MGRQTMSNNSRRSMSPTRQQRRRRRHSLHIGLTRIMMMMSCVLVIIMATIEPHCANGLQPVALGRCPRSMMGSRRIFRSHLIPIGQRRCSTSSSLWSSGQQEDLGEIAEDTSEAEGDNNKVITKAEDLPWLDFSQIQVTEQNSTLPVFASSFIFVASLLGTLYMYYVGIFGMPPPAT